MSPLCNENHKTFFLVIVPGFEDVGKRELEFWLELLLKDQDNSKRVNEEIKILKGGIEINLPYEIGCLLNLCLKIPTRILFRATEFRCRDFTKLYKKLQKVNWNKLIGANDVSWKVSSKLSRLKIIKKIEETCSDSLLTYRKAYAFNKEAIGLKGSELIKVYLNVIDDIVSVSIDTSGEALYKRGYKKNINKAPLRETLASGILWNLLGDILKEENSKDKVRLIDPMMGAGTFLLEAENLFYLNNHRNYSFQNFPSSISEIKNKTNLLKKESPYRKPFDHLLGVDIDEKSLSIVKDNFLTLRKSEGHQDLPLELFVDDIFNSEKNFIETKDTDWLVVNPPYNQRLKVATEKKEFLNDLLSGISEKYSVKKVAVIFPTGDREKLIIPQGWRLEKKSAFLHGGIKVRLYVFLIE